MRYLLSIITICLFIGGCAEREVYYDLAIKNLEINHQASGIMDLILENSENLSEQNQKLLAEALEEIEQFSINYAGFIQQPVIDEGIKRLTASFSRATLAYKQVFHLITDPEIWHHLPQVVRADLANYHNDILIAEIDAKNVHDSYRKQVAFRESAKQAIEAICFGLKIIVPLL